jgi:hypothetical protein
MIKKTSFEDFEYGTIRDIIDLLRHGQIQKFFAKWTTYFAIKCHFERDMAFYPVALPG